MLKASLAAAAAYLLTTMYSFAADDMKVAVSIRYLQIRGLSHARIYLYSGDGELVQQLSSGSDGQDIDPIFTPDGRTVVFTRKLRSGDQYWIAETSGTKSHALSTPPSWYHPEADDTPRFTLLNLEWERWYKDLRNCDESATPEPSPTSTPPPTRLVSPDTSIELILDRTGDDQRDYDNGELGKLYRCRNLKTGEETLLGTWPGFETLWDPLHLRGHDESFFLIEPPLKTVFFFRHLNSTDGNTAYALDLNHQRVIRLSPNDATPIPLFGYPGFFTATEQRYLPLGDGKRTVNCSYLDRWDAEFNKTRYARSAPAIFGGASIFWRAHVALTIHSGIND